eukprot:TRINITY_DN10556_c0_g2_i16.p1 TRINITY_DN10556_c0_g2~~TRINITY_DN10556_c0_g2_i16.p1  ORF type:complete len:278 (+),score=8.65 TRINITY_DN10556_c0_g2_i16:415-1248(+)
MQKSCHPTPDAAPGVSETGRAPNLCAHRHSHVLLPGGRSDQQTANLPENSLLTDGPDTQAQSPSRAWGGRATSLVSGRQGRAPAHRGHVTSVDAWGLASPRRRRILRQHDVSGASFESSPRTVRLPSADAENLTSPGRTLRVLCHPGDKDFSVYTTWCGRAFGSSRDHVRWRAAVHRIGRSASREVGPPRLAAVHVQIWYPEHAHTTRTAYTQQRRGKRTCQARGTIQYPPEPARRSRACKQPNNASAHTRDVAAADAVVAAARGMHQLKHLRSRHE